MKNVFPLFGPGLFTVYSLAGSPWTVHFGAWIGAMSWDQAALLLEHDPFPVEDIRDSGSASCEEVRRSAS